MVENRIRFKFGKSSKLRKRNDILEVVNSGRRLYGKYMLLYFLIKRNIPSRICISVSTKGRTNVQRNKLRRQIREIFRLNKHKFIDGLQLLVNIKNGIKKMEYILLEKDFINLLRANNLIKDE